MFFALCACMGVNRNAMAQCSTTITSFPYNEGFESTDGGWQASSNIHWQWGSPVGKAVIPGAGGGSKCWIAGGLSGSFYSSGSSELVSPCFTFSTLVNPQLSFKIFWETERDYDGVTLLYSTDNAGSWITLGTANSDDPCAGIENWFNNSSVNFVGNKPGWSGNVQSGGGSCRSGQGSGQWLTAKHNLSALSGAGNVIFKFVFGAGTICNAYDGLAIDDINISESATQSAAFGFTCGANSTAQFTNTAAPCQVAWSWNFGDPGSGAANFSTLENPSHIYSTAGTFSVSLTVTYGSGAQATASPANISIPNVSTTVTNVSCSGAQDGAIAASVTPPGAYSYSWNTTPVRATPTINSLAGNNTYTLTVTSPTACSVTVPVSISSPSAISISPVVVDAKCGNNNGSITANATGGTAPYFYTWSNASATPMINQLSAGTYSVSVTDANSCPAASANNLIVNAITKDLSPYLGGDTTICPGQTLMLRPGSFSTYTWQDNSTAASFSVTKSGTYSVVVTDADGCTGAASVKVTVDCRGIYFPAAFTPDADGLNATFGPLGDLAALKNFSIVVYNRYAQIIYTSSDPYEGWNGRFKGKDMDIGTYIWTATYTLRGQKPLFKKGTVVIIR